MAAIFGGLDGIRQCLTGVDRVVYDYTSKPPGDDRVGVSD
jgi:hypothetical protein